MTQTQIIFNVPGVPRGKGRPRVGKTKFGRVVMRTPEETASYENLVKLAGSAAMAGQQPATGPIELTVVAVFPVPASWSKTKRENAKHHTSRPDADNVLKAVLDGLNGVAWIDDTQVSNISIKKVYGAVPGLNVEISCG